MAEAMDWVLGFLRSRSVWRVGAIAALHVAVFGMIMSIEHRANPASSIPHLEIDFAELDSVLDTAPELNREPDPKVRSKPLQDPQAAPVQTAPVTAETTTNTPAVLTQNEHGPDGEISTSVSETSNGDAALEESAISSAQIARVLQNLDCQKLIHRENEACPKTDPFSASVMVAARATVQRNTDWDRSYRAKTTIESIYEQNARDRLNWPDADLTADPMAPGAYTAERVRRGEDPLLSEALRDSFRPLD